MIILLMKRNQGVGFFDFREVKGGNLIYRKRVGCDKKNNEDRGGAGTVSRCIRSGTGSLSQLKAGELIVKRFL